MRAEYADYARAVLRYLALLSVRSGFLYSFLLHVLIFVVAVSDVSFLGREPVIVDRPIPVELVVIAERTNLPKPKVTPEPKTERPEVHKPAPPPAATAPDAVPLPSPPKAKPVKKKEVVQVKVRPKPKPKPPVQKAKKPKFDSAKISALLNKIKKEEKAEEEEPDQPDVKSPPINRLTQALDQPMTNSEIDAVKMQIYGCWSLPAGSSRAESLVVKVRLFLHRDGSLSRQPEVVDAERMTRPGQEYFRTAAESAVRAVRKCEPLRMPAKKYEEWREMVLTFDPSEMLGG